MTTAAQQATADGDLAHLRAQLSASQGTITHRARQLTSAAQTFADSRGHHKDKILGDGAALARAIASEAKRIRDLHVTSAAGHSARELVLRTLTAYEEALDAGQAALAGSKRHSALRSAAKAKHHVHEAQLLQHHASQALGFAWEI